MHFYLYFYGLKNKQIILTSFLEIKAYNTISSELFECLIVFFAQYNTTKKEIKSVSFCLNCKLIHMFFTVCFGGKFTGLNNNLVYHSFYEQTMTVKKVANSAVNGKPLIVGNPNLCVRMEGQQRKISGKLIKCFNKS